jgi:cytochrome c oxidase subunit 2
MTSGRTTAWALAGAMLGVLTLTFALALRTWFPPIASVHGAAIQTMLNFTLAATGLFLVAGHLVLAWLIARAEREPGAAPSEPSARTRRLVSIGPALAMAVVAEGGVLVLALPVWGKYYAPPPPDALQVEVTGRQFFWVVRYPGPDGRFGRTSADRVAVDNPLGLDADDPAAKDDVVLLNEIHLPRDRPAQLLLRSRDVIHSFWVPELRVKQNLVPGMSIAIWFTATRSGRYELACNQICGLGHYRMRGVLQVDEPGDFDHWLSQQRSE